MSLKHALLVLLETEPGSGYDLLKHFKERLGYFWNAKHQQIYQQLKTLHQEGALECIVEPQEGKPDKKVYRVTPQGAEMLKEWLASSVKPSKVNDALLVKIYGGHLTDPQNLIDELDHHIELHQSTLERLYAIEQQFDQLPEDKREQYTLPYITLRRGILGEQAWLQWADEAKKMIKK